MLYIKCVKKPIGAIIGRKNPTKDFNFLGGKTWKFPSLKILTFLLYSFGATIKKSSELRYIQTCPCIDSICPLGGPMRACDSVLIASMVFRLFLSHSSLLTAGSVTLCCKRTPVSRPQFSAESCGLHFCHTQRTNPLELMWKCWCLLFRPVQVPFS